MSQIPPIFLDDNSTRQFNLTVLQGIDPFVKEILCRATHVTFYEFNLEIGQWSLKNVEGCLFVVERNIQPRFQFIVMNRLHTGQEYLVEDLQGDFEWEVQCPYLYYRNAAQEANAIWFYKQTEYEELACLFDRLSGDSKANQKPNMSSSKSEFQESSTAAHSGPVINKDKVEEALLPLVQDGFIDMVTKLNNMVTRALPNAYQP